MNQRHSRRYIRQTRRWLRALLERDAAAFDSDTDDTHDLLVVVHQTVRHELQAFRRKNSGLDRLTPAAARRRSRTMQRLLSEREA